MVVNDWDVCETICGGRGQGTYWNENAEVGNQEVTPDKMPVVSDLFRSLERQPVIK